MDTDGDSFTFTYTAHLASDTLTPHVNKVTVFGTDGFFDDITAWDEATVTFTDVAPTIEVTKTADPTRSARDRRQRDLHLRRQEHQLRGAGHDHQPLRHVYGTLAGDADCKVGTVLAAGASCEFSITSWVEGDSHGPDHVNVFTAEADDNDNTEPPTTTTPPSTSPTCADHRGHQDRQPDARCPRPAAT